jgi:hypothetical protein
MLLVDFPPPTRYNVAAGLEYSYFREWFARARQPRRENNPGLFDFSSQVGYKPHVIVINLGSNDRTKAKPEIFAETMIELIDGMREVHGPDTKIVVMVPHGFVRLYMPPEPIKRTNITTRATTSSTTRHQSPRSLSRSGSRTSSSRTTTTTTFTSTRRWTSTTTAAVIATPFWLVRPPYQPSVYASVVSHFTRSGDPNVYFLDTTGWINSGNVERMMMDSIHPNFEGTRMLGRRVGGWLVRRGILNGTDSGRGVFLP